MQASRDTDRRGLRDDSLEQLLWSLHGYIFQDNTKNWDKSQDDLEIDSTGNINSFNFCESLSIRARGMRFLSSPFFVTERWVKWSIWINIMIAAKTWVTIIINIMSLHEHGKVWQWTNNADSGHSKPTAENDLQNRYVLFEIEEYVLIWSSLARPDKCVAYTSTRAGTVGGQACGVSRREAPDCR